MRRPLLALEGFTPEQRFFVNRGQVWRQTIRPEAQGVGPLHAYRPRLAPGA